MSSKLAVITFISINFGLASVSSATVVWGTAVRARHAVGTVVWGTAVRPRHAAGTVVWGTAVRPRHAAGANNQPAVTESSKQQPVKTAPLDLNQK